MKALVITGGSIELSFGRKVLAGTDWDMIIAADSGLHFVQMTGIMPDIILGDFDSADPLAMEYFKRLCPDRMITYPPEKDETDTELALNAAIEAGAAEIVVLGATGSRLDHVLGNIQLLKRAMDAGVDCRIVDEHNRIRMIKGGMYAVQIVRDEQFGDYVSLIPFTPEVKGLTLTGFKYEVSDFTLESGMARGVSNEIKDETAEISFEDGILLVIESRD